MITLFQKVMTRLYESAEARERAARDAYLADATDLIELEFRMKQLDKAEHQRHWLSH